MTKLETIKSRYQQGFIRHDQLERYVKLGVITKEEQKEIEQTDEN